jgi:hypothetical protein
MRNERMQNQAAAARLPRGVVSQTDDVPPRDAVILAAEQAGRLDTCVEYARRRRDAPYRLDRLLVRLIGKAVARARPCLAEIDGLPHGHAEPTIAAAGIDRAVVRIGNDVMDRPHFAERATQLPRGSLGGAFKNEGTLVGSDQDEDLLHRRLRIRCSRP